MCDAFLLRAAATVMVPATFFGTAIASEERRPAGAVSLNGGYFYQSATDIDGGGEVSSQALNLSGSVELFRQRGRVIRLSAGYRLNAYDFSDGLPGSFAALNAWQDIHTFELGLPLRWTFGDDWSLFAAPSIRFVGEDGADLGDALQGGLIAGMAYRFSDRLTLGPGFGVVSQIEDKASVFPVILIDWKINDRLSLTTGPSTGATLGPGLELNWQVSDRWRFALGARYERLRFRLDDRSLAAPAGVGEDRSIPVYGALSFDAAEDWSVTLLAGVGFGGQLRLENAGGLQLRENDYDPSPFVGFQTRMTF